MFGPRGAPPPLPARLAHPLDWSPVARRPASSFCVPLAARPVSVGFGYELSTRFAARYLSRSSGSNLTSLSPMRNAGSFPSATNFRIVFCETPKRSAAVLEDTSPARLGGVDAGEGTLGGVGDW